MTEKILVENILIAVVVITTIVINFVHELKNKQSKKK